MILKTRTLSLACLAMFASIFALSTQAQKFPIPRHAPAAKAEGAKSQTKANAVSPEATTTCTYEFTSGSGTTYLQFCVSVNGNIVEFQSPLGVEQLAQGPPFEGYGICDRTTLIGYYDYAGNGDSGNWGAPTTVSHTATMVKIERTTGDGAWTLTQTITSASGTNPFAKIVMALKNNSSLGKAVYLYRYANADPDNAESIGDYAENYDGTDESAWGYEAFGSDSPYGLMLQNITNPLPANVYIYDREGFAIDTTSGPSNPCDLSASTTIYNGVGSIMYLYVPELTKNETFTVTDRYISF